ncbi:MAG: hypothetical protein A3C58_00400 [Candidatus Staskawiczbacteria bacterium RIFCSPHIGHO2_02_FULL_34_10]|uniref:Thioredoxin domain-containing protein n=1 Tax=Candidatus Staskawiczbacteria bacterium RIFCSPHIGHO2_02_FULL_34_10 TaxID=1802205 RepID=A0A1G2HTX8_9BACT|nr:MAG: hypothetical protein A3C58_00400 [Candidatus Staskawiczbacteria bacterium RIFCSPHIGHO2_02_FULL_34_10]
MFNINRRTVLLGMIILGLVVVGVLIFGKLDSSKFVSFYKLNFGYSAESIAKKSVEYLNSSVLKDGQKADLVGFSEESGVIKVSIKIDQKTYDSYVTKDGKLFFPEAIIINSNLSKQSTATKDSSVDISKVKIEGSPFIGNKDAKVVIAEWFDYQCPYCKKMEQEVMSKIYDEYIKTGKIKLVFKDYQFLGPDSQTAGLIARAVWEVAPDKFYEWNKAIYEKQDDENSGWGKNSDILTLTKSIGIDSVKVEKLVTEKSSEYQKLIDADKLEGTDFGVKGTPALIIGKELLGGFIPYNELKASIEKVISGN